MEDSITKIGSTAYKSTDGKFLIYKISEEHSQDIRRELPRMGSHYKEASLILPHFQLLKMNFGGEETIYAVSPAYEHQATEVYYLGTQETSQTNTNTSNTYTFTDTDTDTNTNTTRTYNYMTRRNKRAYDVGEPRPTFATLCTNSVVHKSSFLKPLYHPIDQGCPTGNVRHIRQGEGV
ncbi:predicted protein [Lodderomyces elongisporus NRRL YB-4239]|uniref:Uncharacterized protein n=1 Tax=Lodderomyces elongisporus (strain ATCC 11503 / CBS 2605 / JCM 1781 / NBRC 1676 / NRRL YB-4239) TaxID=379508 RepID=A5DXS4_LODEL|nr:predicted protein [Lodderomyces elongisporus NRRL YB-4239]